jgi:hypothetical protein
MSARHKRAEDFYRDHMSKFGRVAPLREDEIVGLLMDHEEMLKRAFVERLVSYEKMVTED